MYTIESSVRYIKKIGLDDFLRTINSDSFPPEHRYELEKIYVIVGGFPNLSLLSKVLG